MAPIVQVIPPRNRGGKSQAAPTVQEPAKFVKPEFLVPLGTEPKLPNAYGHQFGFRPPAAGMLCSNFELLNLILTISHRR